MATNTDLKADYYGKALAVLEALHAEGRLAPSRVEWIERTRNELAKLAPAVAAE